MAHLQDVPVDSIDHNPFRNTGSYPFVGRKIEALQRSIDDVGLWEGIIARMNGDRYELAFGHHRFEAARRSNMTVIPLIIRDLTDEQMLGFMGRENMEDYNADFLAMLETWEAAWKWEVTTRDVTSPQAIEVARLLGWDIPRSDRPELQQMNRTAEACNAARKLIVDKHIDRADLVELTVNEAREICGRAQANIERIEKAGKALGTPAAHTAAAKKAVGKSVKTTARDSRDGVVAQKDLRGQVDVNAYKHANASKTKDTPLFAIFGNSLANSLNKMLQTDKTHEKLLEVISAIPQVVSEDDKGVVRRLSFELYELADRAKGYGKKMVLTDQRVTPLTTIGKGA